jgi:hypothetical protein
MMRRPFRVLDLYCCAGGAGHGYILGGADSVTGIDKVQRDRYPYRFVKADALEYLASIITSGEIERYSLIHTSPPCQAACTLTVGTNASQGWGAGDEHIQHIPLLRPLLDAAGLPYVIEQPEGKAPIRRDLMLCMDMWPIQPPRVFRHRYFELGGWTATAPAHIPHRRAWAGVPADMRRVRGWRGKSATKPAHYSEGAYVAAYGIGQGGGKATVAEARHALGIDWTREPEELSEAIPPRYTQHLAEQFQAWQARTSGLVAPEQAAA